VTLKWMTLLAYGARRDRLAPIRSTRTQIMKLHTAFVQLPLLFDADVLRAEIASFSETDWQPHPAGYAGNDFLPLVSAHGDARNEAFEGPMLPTEHLSADRPYLSQTLAALGAAIGRTRLMRLSPHADVDEHVDVNYYWRDRMRVHVPVITQPTVRFNCGASSIHMAPGETWVFDTWSLHSVNNDAQSARVHLVIDTVGGDGFWSLMSAGRAPSQQSDPQWTPRKVTPSAEAASFDLESVNTPTIMSPWELKDHISFLMSEIAPGQAQTPFVARAALAFLHRWRALWAIYGDSGEGRAQYKEVLERFAHELHGVGATKVVLRNEVELLHPLRGMIFDVAVADPARDLSKGEQRSSPRSR
jgi:aspartyl/asparaginyl beta-hydroxylase